jgi:spermidine/putrescine-binding protein
MKKTIVLLLSLFMLLVACTPATQPSGNGDTPTPPPQRQELIIFTWADYLAPEVIRAFEDETGITVRISYFSDNEEMFLRLNAAGGVGYDLVLASDYKIAESIAAGLAQPINQSLITRSANIGPEFQGHFYDPSDRYTIPAFAGTPLILYDPAQVTVPITGYASLWDPSLVNSVVIFDNARLMMGFTMKMLGGSLNSTEPEMIAAAEEKLMELLPNVAALSFDQQWEMMVSGQATAGLMYSEAIVRALRIRPDLNVVFPEEGMGFGIDAFFITSGAANVDNAHLFLDFILQGYQAAKLCIHADYIICIAAAEAYLPPEVLNNKALYIPPEVLGDVEFMMNIPAAATEMINDAWVRFRLHLR